MASACKHWWINQGAFVERKDALMAEYRCEICGAINYHPLPTDRRKSDKSGTVSKGGKGKRGSEKK